MKTAKKIQPEQVPIELESLIDVVRPHFLIKNIDEIHSRQKHFASSYSDEWQTIQPCIASLFQLDSAFHDCFIAKKLVSKARTSRLGPKPSSYLRYIFVFVGSAFSSPLTYIVRNLS